VKYSVNFVIRPVEHTQMKFNVILAYNTSTSTTSTESINQFDQFFCICNKGYKAPLPYNWKKNLSLNAV